MTRRLLALLAFLVLAAVPGVASAQVSIWLQRGVSGFGVTGGFFGNGDQLGFFTDLGYSYQGFLDFDLNAGATVPKASQAIPDDMVIYTLAPTVQVHPLKQS